MNRCLGLVLLALTLLTADSRGDGPLPAVLRNSGLEQRLDAQVPPGVSFRDEHGKAVRLGAYFTDQPVILVLAYYRCPMLCNQVLNGLVESMRRMSLDLGTHFQVITVSFDAREGPELAAAKKATHVEAYGRPGAEQGWHFLTGEQEAIVQLAQTVGFRFAYDPRQDQFAHPSAIIVLTPQGKVARYFLGIDYPPRDLQLALVEASAGKIGSPVDRAILLCYEYDPTTGRYTGTVLGFVRLGGVLSLAILGMLVGCLWYRDWRKGRGSTTQPVGKISRESEAVPFRAEPPDQRSHPAKRSEP